MKHTYNKEKNFESFYFENIHEMHNFCSQPPKGNMNSSITGDREFTGTKSYNEAHESLLNGDITTYNKIREKIRNEKKVNKDYLISGLRKQKMVDVVGFVPIVPLAIQGMPLNMTRHETVVIEQKVLNVVVAMSASGGHSEKSLQKIAVQYIMAINSLEKAGYRCNIYVCEFAGYDRIGETGKVVKIKTDSQPMNLKKMAYPMCNISMLRRHVFRIDELAEHVILGHGYGQPRNSEEYIRKKIKEMVGLDNFCLLRLQNVDYKELKDVEEEIKKQGIS